MLSFFKRTALLAAAILFSWTCSADDISTLLENAKKGDKEAQYQLAIKYLSQNNEKDAIKWARRAASKPKKSKTLVDVKYLELLAQFYEKGIGYNNKPRYNWAFNRYKECAARKSSFSLYKLGIFYRDNPDGILGDKNNMGLSLRNFEASAKLGYTPAQYELALYYKKVKNAKKCVDNLTKAAEAGHARAQAELGRCYDTGFGVDKNRETAIEWYQKSAEQKDSLGLALLGETFYLVPWDDLEAKPDYRKAYALFLESTKQPNPCAEGMYYMGMCFYNGNGVGKNIKRAASWFEASANMGHAEAQACLGIILLLGETGQVQHSYALNLFRRANLQKNARAQYGLSLCYKNGWGDFPDAGKARFYFEQSAKNGFPPAQYELANYYWKGENGYKKDFKQAINWYKLSAENGYWKSQLELGEYAFEVKDYDTAIKWLTFTAKKDVPKSLYLLALCYKDGLGVPVDLAQAKELMIKASDLNYPGAMDEIAKINEAIKKKAEEDAKKAEEEEKQKKKEQEAQQKEEQADNPPPAN